MTSMWRPRYFAVVSRHEKVPTAPHMSAMPMSRARRALAASRASTADSVFMCVAACGGEYPPPPPPPGGGGGGLRVRDGGPAKKCGWVFRQAGGGGEGAKRT